MTEVVDFAQAERSLLESEFEDMQPLWSSSNYVFVARLCTAGGRDMAAVYKPASGETPLWDFPRGTLYRREVAAYQLSLLLGWPFVPPTVERDGPRGIGSLQMYIDHDPEAHFFAQREDPALVPQLQRMAVFDFIANNADRKGGHCLLRNAHVWGIDHGLCFHSDYKLRTVIWDWSEAPIALEWIADVRHAMEAVEREADKAAPFLALLDRGEKQAFLRRCRALIESGLFPLPGPHRSYPWPLV